MSERKYSVAEIDRMRTAISRKFYDREIVGPNGERWVAGRAWMQPIGGGQGQWDGPDYSAEIEDQIRTYMLAGVDPAELEQATLPKPAFDNSVTKPASS